MSFLGTCLHQEYSILQFLHSYCFAFPVFHYFLIPGPCFSLGTLRNVCPHSGPWKGRRGCSVRLGNSLKEDDCAQSEISPNSLNRLRLCGEEASTDSQKLLQYHKVCPLTPCLGEGWNATAASQFITLNDSEFNLAHNIIIRNHLLKHPLWPGRRTHSL